MFITKLPLIVIVALKSCIVNRQVEVGVRDSKYVVVSDPLLTHHVT